MKPGNLSILFTSGLPCKSLTIPIYKMGIVIFAPRDGQGLQSTIQTSVMKGRTLTKAPWERDVDLICHQIFLGCR